MGSWINGTLDIEAAHYCRIPEWFLRHSMELTNGHFPCMLAVIVLVFWNRRLMQLLDTLLNTRTAWPSERDSHPPRNR